MYWADSGVLNVVSSYNIATSSYQSVGVYAFTFTTQPPNSYYVVNANGVWKEDEGYSNIITFNIHSKSTSGFRAKQYRVDNDTSDKYCINIIIFIDPVLNTPCSFCI